MWTTTQNARPARLVGMRKRVIPQKPRYLYLGEWREARGLTQEQVGERLDVDKNTVARWEQQKGNRKPDIDIVAALAEVYDIEPQEFYNAPDSPSADTILRKAPTDIRDSVLTILRRHTREE